MSDIRDFKDLIISELIKYKNLLLHKFPFVGWVERSETQRQN